MTHEYLELLSDRYPNETSVCSELINLESILALPKGTEHFISDLHGEYDAVCHILNNCSGVILEKVRTLFQDTLGEEGCHALCSVIYYPAEELSYLREQGKLSRQRLSELLLCMCELAELLAGKYTRSYVRKQIPEGFEFVLDELIHVQRNEDENQQRYHNAIISSILSNGAGESVIAALSELIKRLAVDRLHVVGDIFDRGPQPDRIIEMLMHHENLDLQWGNHDILWLGAAAGSAACIFTVLRISLDYGNEFVLERSYGISLRPLSEFCERVYGGNTPEKMRQALNVLGFKLEGHVIMRHPGFNMDERLMLNYVDYDKGTVRLETGEYPLNTDCFPTIDKYDPYRLTAEEQALTDEYISAFKESRSLRRHINFIYRRGSTYLCCNGNLLYHGCIPLNEDGSFAVVRYSGKSYSGKALMDYADQVVSRAWVQKDESVLDMIWYLWCGKDSPFSGRSFHTFERAVVDDQSTWEEPKNPYFSYLEDISVAKAILEQFGLCSESGHIINGHTPVRVRKGESPIKAGGKLFVIDGGFCKAYQKTTGIAGYTLIYNSHGLRLKAHRPFNGVAAVLTNNADMESDSVSVETFPKRRSISDTDEGEQLILRTKALKELLSAYRTGELDERTEGAKH